jgi:hypothetical protein
MALVMAAGVSSIFPNAASRQEIDKLIGAIPSSMVNLFGKPVQLGTLGGYFSWKYGAIFALGTSLWSIMALSGTLAGEAGHGSLDLVAAAPFGKRRIALEKVAAHLTILTLALAVLAFACVGRLRDSSGTHRSATRFRRCPRWATHSGSASSPCSSAAWPSPWRPLLGRAGSAGVAAAVMIVLWLANGFEALAPLRR